MHKILVVIPYPPDHTRPRIKFFSKCLDESDFEVTFLLPENSNIKKLNLRHKNIKFYKNEKKIFKFFRVIYSLFKGIPITYSYYYSPSIKNIANECDFDLIFTKRIPVETISKYKSKIIFDCVDCFSYQTKLFSKTASGIRKVFYFIDSIILPRYEKKIFHKVNKVLLTTPLEKARFLDAFKGVDRNNKIIPVFHSADENISYVNEYPDNKVIKSNDKTYRAFFHGKLTYHQNFLGLKHLQKIFSNDSVSLKWKAIILGDNKLIDTGRFNKLILKGFVNDLKKEYEFADIGIFPIKDCVGIQNKVLEVIGMGKSLLITPQILETLPKTKIELILEKGLYVRDIEHFKEFLEDYNNLNEKNHRQNLEEYYINNFSSKECEKKFINIFKE